MEKRLILAIALSLLVLLAWSALIPQPPSRQSPLSKRELPSPLPLPQALSPELGFNFATEKLELVFSEPQAAVSGVIFKDYQGYKLRLEQGFALDRKDWIFQRERSRPEEISFLYVDKEKKIKKVFNFLNSNSYGIELFIEVENMSNLPINVQFPLTIGILDFAGDQNLVRFQGAFFAAQERILHLDARKEMQLGEVKFLGIRDKYFALLVEPESPAKGCLNKISNQETKVGIILKEIVLKPGEKKRQKLRIYLGPQELQYIKAVNSEWVKIIHYGTFDFIAQILLQLLNWLYQIAHNWGLVIILLSLVIFILLYPFTLKQMRSMKEMQKLQPGIAELRKIYKANPQKLNKEILDLYREHKVNPLGGCLPLILQIPVFFALYQVMMRSVVLKGAHFLWIKDLSEPDRLAILPISLPILGKELNILPILMAALMFMQQKFSMSATSSASTEQQKILFVVMPLMFGFIFYHLPSGLVLYWLMNSLFMLLYQWRVNRAP